MVGVRVGHQWDTTTAVLPNQMTVGLKLPDRVYDFEDSPGHAGLALEAPHVLSGKNSSRPELRCRIPLSLGTSKQSARARLIAFSRLA